jgi:hypothetical protein
VKGLRIIIIEWAIDKNIIRRHLLNNGQTYFFLFGRCVNADPAAVLAALLNFGSRKTLEAAVAALEIEIEPTFDAGRKTKLPVAALRPKTRAECDEFLGFVEFEDLVAIQLG